MEIQLKTATGIKALLFEKARVSILLIICFLRIVLDKTYVILMLTLYYIYDLILNDKIIFYVVMVEYFNLKQLNSITMIIYSKCHLI